MVDLLNEIYQSSIILSLDGDNLKLGFKDELIDDNLVKKIKDNKEEIVSYLTKYSSKKEQNNIPRIERQESYEVSSGSLGMLSSILLDTDKKGFNYAVPNSFRLKQDINLNNFQRAVKSTIERHESLRTVFNINEEGQIRQQVIEREAINFKTNFYDFRTIEKREEKVKIYTRNDVGKPFDISKGPLLRVCLFQLEDNVFIFYCNIHHVISDSWSLDILFKDIFSFYSSFEQGVKNELPELPIQYKDYAVWQNQQIAKGHFKSQEKYFRDTFSGEIPIINFTNNKNRPAVKTVNGFALKSYFSKETTKKFNKLCNDNKGSVFMGLLAVWNILLYKYTHSRDIIIGTSVAGRDHADLKDQIGCYINLLPLRNQIEPDQTFSSFFETVKDNTLNALNCQFYPFNNLLALINHKKDKSRSPLFDVMLLLQNAVDNSKRYHVDEKQKEGITRLGKATALTDLDINFVQEEDFLCCHLVFNTDVFESEYVTGLLTHLKQLVEAIVLTPNILIKEIDFVSEEERGQIINEFNTNITAFSHNKTVVELFGEQVDLMPNKTAMLYEHKSFTYKELDQLSNRLANYLLLNYKIEVEDLIGIKLERSEWLIISILAVIKTGGAYVPIDPTYPKERISYIEQDSGCRTIIDEDILEAFKATMDLNSDKFPGVNIDSENLLYVIYTSGSTGNPKGVMITHKNATSFLHNTGHRLNFKDYGVIAGTTNIVFDISFLEIFGSLCNGKKLALFSTEQLLHPELFIEKLNKDKVEILQITPSRFNQVFDFMNFKEIKYLKQLLIGGEAFPEKLFETKELYTNVDIINVYGPTETTIWSTSLDIKSSSSLSIGKPLYNEKVYILSEHLELQPIGVVGEICIGGEGLARGYLNRSELTNTKFINNPFGDGRIYKTGDLGKWLPDGNLVCVGREDDQIKIRGHRIELGEIERVIETNSPVDKAVLKVKEIGEARLLIAYIVSNKKIDKKKLRETLKNFLPEYMVPSLYVQVEKFTLNANGKVDKGNLPSISEEDRIKNKFIAPRTALEKQILLIWEEVLEVEKIGITDNFFNLGGDSIKSIQIFSKIKKLGYLLNISDIILYPRVKDFIPRLRKRDEDSKSFKVNEVVVGGITSSTPGDNFFEINNASDFQVTPNQNVILEHSMSQGIMGPIVVPGFDTKEEVMKEFASFMTKFPILRTQFYIDNNLVRQRILPASKVPLIIYEENRLDQERINAILTEPFDVIEGALIKILFIHDVSNHTGQESYFYLSIHHALTDAFTNTIILQNLRDCFKKQPVQSNYVTNFDYSCWQHSYLKSTVANEQRHFWLKNLEEVVKKESSGKKQDLLQDCVQQTVWIKDESFKNFSALIKKTGLTSSAFFTAIHQLLLFKHVDCKLQLILVEGREFRTHDVAISKVLGVVNNFLPIPVVQPSEIKSSTYVKEVYSKYIEALSCQQIPYQVICEDIESKHQVLLENQIGGLLNFKRDEAEKHFSIPVVEEKVAYSKNDFTRGLDLNCNVYPNAVEVSISCSLETYNSSFPKGLELKQYLIKLSEEII